MLLLHVDNVVNLIVGRLNETLIKAKRQHQQPRGCVSSDAKLFNTDYGVRYVYSGPSARCAVSIYSMHSAGTDKT